ncbi:hypothetical protein DMX01_06815 [Pseudomonas fulva]|nr:hypothetical protein DMX01_06815 [Pseudomonas fulva]PYC17171.1 hypothetical protein DMX00_03440 [Pseudomonas fulva]
MVKSNAIGWSSECNYTLLESELAELGDELQASREKISTLVVMWSGVTAELRAAEAKLIKMSSPDHHDRSGLG